MLAACVDHLVITAPTLEFGVDYVRSTLGVEPSAGGKHERMGTHNRLTKLGDDVYLEVIAIDPNGTHPDQPRWFQLDAPASSESALATWVMRVNDIQAGARALAMPHGQIQRMSRGELNWSITIPSDGRLQHQGTVPALIQWDAAHYPASRLPDSGCTLQLLELQHPQPQHLRTLLTCVNFKGPVQVTGVSENQPARLVAHIQTPNGLRKLHSPGL
jgi:hypothetical protein